MSQDILLVGSGNMGFAMMSAWVGAGDDLSFHVVEPAHDLRQRAAQAGVAAFAGVDELPRDFAPALIFLAVKPQVMGEVAPAYAHFAAAGSTVVSIAAGVSVATLAGHLGSDTAIIRSMPNTPAAIGEGMMVSFANEQVGEAARALTDRLLAACGQSAWIDDEALMDAVTAISGSGPAYVFHFIECLASAATEVGLSAELAERLAIQTVAGAGLLARGSEEAPAILRQRVTSPGGTTAAALEVLMGDNALGDLVKKAAKAARDRGRELGKG